MLTIAFPDGSLSVFEPTEDRGRALLASCVTAARGLGLGIPVTFELRDYPDPSVDDFTVIETATAEPIGVSS